MNIQEISKELESKIRYEDNGHKYFRVDSGKLLAGVSSVSSLVKSKDSDGFLAQWKVNECIEYIKSHSELGIKDVGDETETTYEISESELKNSKYAHKEKGKEATDIGTRIHEILEGLVNARIEGKEYKYVKDDIIDLFIKDFLVWEKANQVEWLASELLVGDLENDVAGRLDGLAMVNGKLTIIDFKAANSVPSNYFIQLSGYALCLKAMGIEVEDRIIIRLPKTPKRKVWVEEKKRYEMQTNKIEFITPPTNWNFDQKCFIHAREVYKWVNYAENNKY